MALQGTVTDTQPHIVPLYAATIHNAIATGDLAQLQALSAQADGLVAQQGDLGGAVAAIVLGFCAAIALWAGPWCGRWHF